MWSVLFLLKVSFAAFECPLGIGIAWTLGTGLMHNRLQRCIVQMEQKARNNTSFSKQEVYKFLLSISK